MKHYIFYTLLSLELCCMSCGKTPPLQIERTPYNGSLRTDGFYYYTYCPKRNGTLFPERTYFSFTGMVPGQMFRDSTLLRMWMILRWIRFVTDLRTFHLLKGDGGCSKNLVTHCIGTPGRLVPDRPPPLCTRPQYSTTPHLYDIPQIILIKKQTLTSIISTNSPINRTAALHISGGDESKV